MHQNALNDKIKLLKENENENKAKNDSFDNTVITIDSDVIFFYLKLNIIKKNF